MSRAPSYKSLLARFNGAPQTLRDYFPHFPGLVQHFPYEVALAYLFLRTEMAQNRALYCGVVKLHRADAGLAQNAVKAQHLTREGFQCLYERVFGERLQPSISDKLKRAEKIRDKVVHGKIVNTAEMREAMCDVLDYAADMNAQLEQKAGFQPFGDLRGFKGRAEPLDRSTSRWLLKGIGFRFA